MGERRVMIFLFFFFFFGCAFGFGGGFIESGDSSTGSASCFCGREVFVFMKRDSDWL